MTPAGVSSNQDHSSLKPRIVSGLCLSAYVLAVFGLTSLFNRGYIDFWPTIAVPIFAELVLTRSEWTTARFTKAVGSRFAGLVIGSTLSYWVFADNFVFDGKDAYSQDFLLTMIRVILEFPIAVAAWLISRRLLPGSYGDTRRFVERPIVSMLSLGVYALVIAGLSSLFYSQFVFVWPLIAVPMLAELALVRSEWTAGTITKATISRAIGIGLGNAILYYVYIMHFVFDGEDLYGEDAILTWIVAAIEIPIAAWMWSMHKRVIPDRRGDSPV